MNFKIHTSQLQYHIAFPGGFWQLSSHTSFPWLRCAPICFLWRDGGKESLWIADSEPDHISGPETMQTNLGQGQQITFDWDSGPGKIQKNVQFVLSLDQATMLWRFRILNHSERSIRLERMTMLHTASLGSTTPLGSGASPAQFDLSRASHQKGINLGEGKQKLAFFTNGWQSWNYAGTLGFQDAFPRSRLGFLTLPTRITAGTPRPEGKGHFLSDMFGVLGDRVSKTGILAGFLSQRQSFGTIEAFLDPDHPQLTMWTNLDGVRLDPNQSFTTDWAFLECVNLEESEILANYMEASARMNDARRNRTTPVGWCSWYHAFESVTESFLLSNVDWASKNRSRIPLQVMQLDDGYEKTVGDWFILKEAFPNGLDHLSSRIRDAGFTPGLWLAPFVAKRNSTTAQKNRDWILRNRWKMPANAGYLWNSFPYALDVTHPGVLDHIRELIDKVVHELGFPYLKLDFLYAGALPGIRHDPNLTRAQGLYQALHVIREAAGEDVDLLGCGCPLGSGIGIFDFMRISPDVAPQWIPSYQGIKTFLEKDEGMPSVRNAVLTTINRAPMHGRWWVNDPDCLLIRSTDTQLSEAEVQTLATVIALSGGSLIVSDDLPALTEERIDWLSRMIPPLPVAARAVDWFDTPYPAKLIVDLESPLGKWHLIGLINWSDQAAELVLDLREFSLVKSIEYHVVDFWNERYRRLSQPSMSFPDIPPHGVCLLALRPVSKEPHWIGDTLHVSQGLGVKEWCFHENHACAKLDFARRATGKAWLGIHGSPKVIRIDGREAEWRSIDQGVIQITLDFNEEVHLEISW